MTRRHTSNSTTFGLTSAFRAVPTPATIVDLEMGISLKNDFGIAENDPPPKKRRLLYHPIFWKLNLREKYAHNELARAVANAGSDSRFRIWKKIDTEN